MFRMYFLLPRRSNQRMYSSSPQSTTQQQREYREIIRNEKPRKWAQLYSIQTINHQIKSAYQMNPVQLEDVRRALVASDSAVNVLVPKWEPKKLYASTSVTMSGHNVFSLSRISLYFVRNILKVEGSNPSEKILLFY